MAKRTAQTISVFSRCYGDIFPYNMVLVYKKDGDFRDMVDEAKKGFPDLKRLDSEPFGDGVSAFVFSDDTSPSGNIYLFFTDSLTIDVLVHECVHVTSRVFDKLDSELNPSTEEIFAYTMEFMFRDIYYMITDKMKVDLSKISR
jgi:hypothetical protein